jgi:hypothetical protein
MKLRRLRNLPADFFIHCALFSPSPDSYRDRSGGHSTSLTCSLYLNRQAQIRLYMFFAHAKKFCVLDLAYAVWPGKKIPGHYQMKICLTTAAHEFVSYHPLDARLPTEFFWRNFLPYTVIKQ